MLYRKGGRHDESLGCDLPSLVAFMVLPCRETDGAWDVYLKCYLPEAALTEHGRADLYRQFRDGGWLTLTSREVVDYRFVETHILDLAIRLTLGGVNVDTRFQG